MGGKSRALFCPVSPRPKYPCTQVQVCLKKKKILGAVAAEIPAVMLHIAMYCREKVLADECSFNTDLSV